MKRFTNLSNTRNPNFLDAQPQHNLKNDKFVSRLKRFFCLSFWYISGHAGLWLGY